MMLSNVIVDVTIPRRSFVFGQSRAKVSASFTNVNNGFSAGFTNVFVHPDDQTQPTFEMTPGFKPFTRLILTIVHNLRVNVSFI